MELVPLTQSRKKVHSGDVFAMRFDEGPFVFGRVIEESVPLFGYGALLLYVYDDVRSSPDPDIEFMVPDRLLLPPVMTNRLGWRHGYFETVGHADLREVDKLPRHCFQNLQQPPRYFDDSGLETTRTEPCGKWALTSYLGIGMMVDHALSAQR